MKKSLSLLVAIAMVFSMFATVVSAAGPAEGQSAGEYLNQLGVIKGNGTDLKEDQTWKRQDIVVLLSRLLGVEAAAKATAKSHEFTDVTDKNYDGYISWAVEEGLVQGKGNGKFGYGDELKTQEFYALVLRAFKVEVAYDEVPAKAVEMKLAAEGTDFAAVPTRGATYSTIVTALNTEVPGTGKTLGEVLGLIEVEAPAIAATPVGVKKVEVKFNKAVDDTKAEISVKKGPSTINVSSKKFSEDKKSVVLELASKLTAGDYTVTVKGVETTDLTSTFTAVNETVTKIEFLTKNAPLKALPTVGQEQTELEIPYQVLNNYGENVTKTTSLSSNIAGSAGGPIPAKGIVSVKGLYRLNDTVTVSLIHPQTATSAVETLTVVAPARVAEIEITGLYNKDGKTLDDSTNLTTDAFYLLATGKDQYGNTVNSVDRFNEDVIVYQTNTTVVVLPNTFEAVEIDGTDKIALKLAATASGDIKVGSSTVTLISNSQGKSANFNVIVAETVRADVVNLINPGDVYAKEKAVVPVEVYDKNGNAITDVRTLNNSAKGVTVTVGGVSLPNAFATKDGGVQIEIPKDHASLENPGQVTVVAQSASLKVQHVLLTVKEAGVPTVIRGLKSDFAKAYKVNSNATLKHSNIDVEDQHGRILTNDQVAEWLATAGNKIVITETANNNAVNFAGNEISAANVATGVAFTAGAVNGSEKITISLSTTANPTVANSAAEVTLHATDGSQFASYSVDSIGKVLDVASAVDKSSVAGVASSSYEKTVKVYGVLSNGAKVQLDTDEFFVSALTNASVNAAITKDKIAVTSKLSGYGDNNELTVPVKVTILANAKEVVQNVTFSKELPKVTAVKFVEGNDVDGSAVTSVTVTGSTYTAQNFFGNGTHSVVVTDQYGVKKLVDTSTGYINFLNGITESGTTNEVGKSLAASYIFSPVTGQVTISSNPLQVTGLDAGEEVDLRVTFVGGQSTTLRIKR